MKQMDSLMISDEFFVKKQAIVLGDNESDSFCSPFEVSRREVLSKNIGYATRKS